MQSIYFNIKRLNKISNNNNALAVKMIDYYLETVPANLEQMKGAIHSANWGLVGPMAHELLNTMSAMGFERMKDPLKEIEKYALEGEATGQIPKLFKKVEKLHNDSYIELKGIRDQLMGKL